MRIRKRFVIGSIFLICLLSTCFAFLTLAREKDCDVTVKVMTRNMYPGADLDAIVQAETEDELENAILDTILSVLQSRIPERAFLVAAEIAETKPDIIALQEVTTWKIGSGRDSIVLDQLDLLLKSLHAMGQHYKKAVVQTLTDVEIPEIVSYTDHDAILVRADLPLNILKRETHLYDTLLSFPAFGDELTVLRGWMAIDVKIKRNRFKFVNTHLEAPLPGIPETQGLQVLQAMQLVEDLSEVRVPVILAGDFNSNAEPTPPGYPPDQTASYSYIIDSGYNDPWHTFHTESGYTWPLFLPDPYEIYVNEFAERIDFIFTNSLESVSIERTGVDPVYDDLYASDHAGLIAEFDLENQ